MMLGDYVGDGSLDYFAEMMNEKAAELGAVNTHFVNASGMHDDDHYTTAYDMYLITMAALENETFPGDRFHQLLLCRRGSERQSPALEHHQLPDLARQYLLLSLCHRRQNRYHR